VQLDFAPDKKTVLVFGENGTGKSTIVDAIDFVCNAVCGSISERSSTNHSHLIALNRPSTDLKVEMTCATARWIATLNGRNVIVNGPENRPTAKILRRSQILTLINAVPRERYNAIEDFVEVPGIQKSELSLREAKKTAEQQHAAAVQAQNVAIDALKALYKEKARGGEGGFVKWVEQEAQKTTESLSTIIESMNVVLAAIGKAITARSNYDAARRKVAESEATWRKAMEALRDALQKHKDSGLITSLIPILQNAQHLFETVEGVTTCPVCEASIDAKSTQKNIELRLAEYGHIVALIDDCKRADKDVDGNKALLGLSRKAVLVSVKDLSEVVNSHPISRVTELDIDWTRLVGSHETDNHDQDEIILALAAKALDLLQSIEDNLKKEHQDASESLVYTTSIKRHFTTIQEKTQTSIQLSKVADRLASLLQVAENARKLYVENILASVSQSVESLYSLVHPDENIGGIRFYLDPRYQRSLMFDGVFHNANQIPPQAYYSESHLDTLGVCIFLALAKYFNDGNTVVVLDDVFTSVDQAHMTRLITMLHDEVVHFNQLVITTHYRPWRDRYRYAQGPIGNVQLIELLPWSLPRGIRHTKTKLSVEELQEHIGNEPLDRQIVSSKAGILLESMLDHLVMTYQCKVPRKPQLEFTLGELLGALGSGLKRALKSEVVNSEHPSVVVSQYPMSDILARINTITWIRNQVGCHWNLSGADLSDSDVRELADATMQLAGALICESCGEMPSRVRAGSYRECRCKQKRLHPCINPD